MGRDTSEAPSAVQAGRELTQLTEALPELAEKFGKAMSRQTALNLIDAARLATVLMIVWFLRKKAREQHWIGWGGPVVAVRQELHLEVGRFFQPAEIIEELTGPPAADDFHIFLDRKR